MVRQARQPETNEPVTRPNSKKSKSNSSTTFSAQQSTTYLDPNPDYVTCPTCSRRFNEDSGARHIPLCKEKMVQQIRHTSSRGGTSLVKEDMLKRRTAYKPPPPKVKPQPKK